MHAESELFNHNPGPFLKNCWSYNDKLHFYVKWKIIWQLDTYRVIKSVSSLKVFHFIKKLYKHLYSLFARQCIIGLANIQYDSQEKTKAKKNLTFQVFPIWQRRKNETKNLNNCAQITSKKKMFVDHILFSFIMPVVLKLYRETGLLETNG